MARVGDLLVRADLISSDQLVEALTLQRTQGGRLGDILINNRFIDGGTFESFLRGLPPSPETLADLGIEHEFLVDLFLKQLYGMRSGTIRQFADSLKVPSRLAKDMLEHCTARNYVTSVSNPDTFKYRDLKYALSEAGARRAKDAMEHSRYVGPVPVSLAAFTERVSRQKVTNEAFTVDAIRSGLSNLELSEALLMEIGPAVNSGRAFLLYGPAGNGKSSVALNIRNMFHDMVYIPYSVLIDNNVVRVFDPRCHTVIETGFSDPQRANTSLGNDEIDTRWLPCDRPFVLVGGELTLDMLEMSYDEISGYYEAPLHIKALDGCFVIDDFGRQRVKPHELLNRWIVPMERRIETLKLKSGKTFELPFEVMLIFSTNLEPSDLMDDAFLRRLPYKIQVGTPTPEQFRTIFKKRAMQAGLTVDDAFIDLVMRKITEERGRTLAGFHPGFIIDQFRDHARFYGERYTFNINHLERVLDNLLV